MVDGEKVSSTIHIPNETLFLYYLKNTNRPSCDRYFWFAKCVLPKEKKEYQYESSGKQKILIFSYNVPL